jgi:neurofibromin 1
MLGEFLPDIHLPKSTLSLDQSSTTISPVNLIAAYNNKIPVSLKLSADCMQIIHLATQDILDFPALIKDIIHFGDFDDSASKNSYENGLYIRFSERVAAFTSTGGSSTVMSTIVMSSPKREIILGAIRAAQVKWHASHPDNIVRRAGHRHLVPSDVPGTLLNIVMLNSCSDDSELRVASYNLLCTLNSSFDFKLSDSLLISEGLECILMDRSLHPAEFAFVHQKYQYEIS